MDFLNCYFRRKIFLDSYRNYTIKSFLFKEERRKISKKLLFFKFIVAINNFVFF